MGPGNSIHGAILGEKLTKPLASERPLIQLTIGLQGKVDEVYATID